MPPGRIPLRAICLTSLTVSAPLILFSAGTDSWKYLDRLETQVFQKQAQLGLIQEFKSGRFLPGVWMGVQPVEFQIEP